MKTNLKNFPPIEFGKGWDGDSALLWKKDFERELREQLTPRIISAMAELVDDRSDFQKGWKIGYIDCLKQILGE